MRGAVFSPLFCYNGAMVKLVVALTLLALTSPLFAAELPGTLQPPPPFGPPAVAAGAVGDHRGSEVLRRTGGDP